MSVMDHDSVLFFTQDGVARSLKAFQIPEGSRTAIGSAITQVGAPACSCLQSVLGNELTTSALQTG